MLACHSASFGQQCRGLVPALLPATAIGLKPHLREWLRVGVVLIGIKRVDSNRLICRRLPRRQDACDQSELWLKDGVSVLDLSDRLSCAGVSDHPANVIDAHFAVG